MVFIRPVILRTEKNSIQVTGSKYAQTRQVQLDIARDQDQYNAFDQTTVLPALRNAKLPKPFFNKGLNPNTATK